MYAVFAEQIEHVTTEPRVRMRRFCAVLLTGGGRGDRLTGIQVRCSIPPFYDDGTHHDGAAAGTAAG